MSDIYIPGISSRFNTDQIIDGLMAIESIPRDRVATNIDTLQLQRRNWQILGNRITALRESARNLFSFENPFNNKLAVSSDSSVITATTTRNSEEQAFNFTVKQVAQADRFISRPLNENMRVEAGNYIFRVGDEEIPINFRGGTLREFADIINRQGRDKIAASLLAVQSGTRSLILESKVTGAENRLSFGGDTVAFVTQIGMMEQVNDSQRQVAINSGTVRSSGENSASVSVNNGILLVPAKTESAIPIGFTVDPSVPMILRIETQTRIESGDSYNVPGPPPGPNVPSGSVSYGGITILNDPSSAPFPEWVQPPAPVRIDNLEVLKLVFSDGTSAALPAITDSSNLTPRQYSLAEIAPGKTIVSLSIENNNTHREISIGNIELYDSSSTGGLRPLNPVSTAQDAIISMEGIEITRATNNIDDLIVGVTLNIRGVSDRPVNLSIRSDIEAVKDAIINFVGNYNRLMAEINVLTAIGSTTTRRVRDERGNWVTEFVRNYDESIVDELTYLTPEEAADMKSRLGALSGESLISSLKNNLRMAVSSPYPTIMERELVLLAQIGISTNATGATGYSASRLRGYLEINERMLDAALENYMPAIRQLFASDTDGDLLNDTGAAVMVDNITSPFIGTGGLIALKTGTIDSRISQDQNRIQTLDRQLAAREQELRIQFARMEEAYARMESMTSSLNNFSNSFNNR